jgi:hypothetical protein
MYHEKALDVPKEGEKAIWRDCKMRRCVLGYEGKSRSYGPVTNLNCVLPDSA